MWKVSILIIAIILGCSRQTKQSESIAESEKLIYSGALVPRLLANNKAIWDLGGLKSVDTLQRGDYNLAFEMLNYSRYTDKSLENPLIEISKIDFRVETTTLDTILNPIIKETNGLLNINLDTITSSNLKYYVDMNLKFTKTDSTYKYNGVIYLRD
jgi:hypothetical protein